jgi:hypothetical protein
MTATYETDQAIAVREWSKGYEANRAGEPITNCPWTGGIVEYWWKQGYNGSNPPAGMIRTL